jgi:hypothetical protein
MTNVDATNQLRFPVLEFANGMVFFVGKEAGITECSSYALKRGFFSGLLLVDSTGRAVRVKGAKKLHGIGPFWGYNIFLNQRIKIELIPDGAPYITTVNELRKLILDAFRGKQEWSARSDFDELTHRAERAESIEQLVRIIGDAYQSP